MTAFVALVTMDANRQKAGRFDWCCCFTSKKYLAEQVRTRMNEIRRSRRECVFLVSSGFDRAYSSSSRAINHNADRCVCVYLLCV